jgi:hypothetical protein
LTEYEEFEALVIEKDMLDKETSLILQAYLREFGDLINAVFEKEISCIQKKKTIAFCQAAVNKNQLINSDELNAYLESEMATYKTQLERMIDDTKASKKAEVSDEYDVQKAKAIYRRIAKRIHPDLNPSLYEDPEDTVFYDLWDKAVVAYHTNDPTKLIEIEVLINREFKKRGIEDEEPVIEDIEMKIAFLKEEINLIKTTEPYLFKRLLEDDEACEEKKNSLEAQLKDYTEYEEQLNAVLKTYLINGVEITWKPDSQ